MANLAIADRAPADNWLYGRQTPYCSFDLNYTNSTMINTPAGRVAMSGIYLMAFVAVWMMPRRREETPGSMDRGELGPLKALKVGDDAPPPLPKERWHLLDLVRISCVFCVISEHSGGTVYSEHDTMLVTHWVLQWLFIVSVRTRALDPTAFVLRRFRPPPTSANAPFHPLSVFPTSRVPPDDSPCFAAHRA
jgi:hypothetical protein